ncbi:carotenoid oxygenase family protein [Variovorax sp. GB1P17]|uniref:carotenoid oxygenase family protein n=1 Tax=Variovorax sp. GB1P17 TaxID=3443740 RepID=UPI003F47C6C3
MAQAFPTDDPFLSGYYAPLHAESDAPNLPITGEMPPGLRGTLYRNGPNPQFAPRGRYHWFSGDGMLHAFHIDNGRVSYRNRWVRTPKWAMENEHGEGMTGSLGSRHLSDPRILELNSTVANTNVVWHGERLLALEEVHAPFEVDPVSLEPRGYHDFAGKLSGPMTAHPKMDPVTGEMVFFGYAARGPFTPDLMLHVVDRAGKLQSSMHIVAPFPSMVHDFVVTRTHVLFPIFPLTGSMERVQSGRPGYAWEPDKGTHIGIVPRDGTAADVRWFTGDPSYVFHPMNGFDTEDGKIVCDMMKYEVAPLFPLPDGRPSSERPPTARLVRWTFDLAGASRTYKEQPLDDLPGEFPRLDERFAMRPYRHGYYCASAVTEAIKGRHSRGSLAHIDLASGGIVRWQPPEGDHCGEPIFVPRHADAEEGDGWLLSVIWRGADNRSDLAVFNATDLAAGPVALAHLSHRVPAGFHGNWRAEA